MKFVVPEPGIFDDPVITVSLNREWLSYIDGAIGLLLRDGTWDGDDDTVDSANQQIRQLLALFAPLPPGPTQNFWGNDEPDYDGFSEGDPGAVGLRFKSSVDATITGIRFYRFPGSGNGQIGYLFDAAHVELGEANFPDDTLGWVTAEFSTPIAITADTPYMAVQFLTNGYVPYKLNVFTSDVTVGDLTAYADEGGVGLRNGTFCVCVPGSYPEGGFSAVNWFIDVELVPD